MTGGGKFTKYAKNAMKGVMATALVANTVPFIMAIPEEIKQTKADCVMTGGGNKLKTIAKHATKALKTTKKFGKYIGKELGTAMLLNNLLPIMKDIPGTIQGVKDGYNSYNNFFNNGASFY